MNTTRAMSASLLFVLLASLWAALPTSAQAQEPDADPEAFVGTWSGTLETSQDTYNLVFRLEHSEEDLGEETPGEEGPAEKGPLDGRLFNAGEFATPSWPLSRVSVQGDSITLEAGSISLEFRGALAESGSSIEGTVRLATGEEVPLALSPADDSVSTSLSTPSPETQRPEANPADVKSPEAIVKAVYDVVSNSAGEERDWDRYRSLFLPDAHLTLAMRPEEGESQYHSGTVEEYIEQGHGEMHAQQIHAVTERFGDMAHVFSTYEIREAAGDSEPSFRGINSFHLWHDGDRWWIVDLMWQNEGEGATIPERYLN